jgi:hypothetical protein
MLLLLSQICQTLHPGDDVNPGDDVIYEPRLHPVFFWFNNWNSQVIQLPRSTSDSSGKSKTTDMCEVSKKTVTKFANILAIF